jgi:hypothetical protein
LRWRCYFRARQSHTNADSRGQTTRASWATISIFVILSFALYGNMGSMNEAAAISGMGQKL